jgi:hypothetical protein
MTTTDYTAKIRAKGCANTGITEKVAAQLYKRKGDRLLVIAEVKVDETHEKADGDRRVDLIIETIEPVVGGDLNGQAVEAVRRVQRALYVNRQTDEQLPLAPGETPEPAIEDTVKELDALVETDEAGQVAGFFDPANEPAPA